MGKIIIAHEVLGSWLPGVLYQKCWPRRPDASDVMEIETVLDVEGLGE